MRINNILLKNFRQYEGSNSIDLRTTDDKNIILIGGKNGYGKTNFLMSIVWCLFGEDIGKIDENFKREIQKEGNYIKFLKSSLNWSSAQSGENKFSVEIQISDIELPETVEIKSGNNYSCILRRTFDVNSNSEELEITIEGIKKNIFNSEDEKKIFINDYLIPIEAAKFVFFDAEKIANWAELSTKEEGSVLNDALGKILGLDIYEALISDLEIYTDGLRKESATSIVKQQINSVEKGILHNVEEIEKKENEILDKEIVLFDLKQKIIGYETFLVKLSNKVINAGSLDELYKNKKDLELKGKELENKFNQLSEIIPFAVSAGKLEEVTEHLAIQQEDLSLQEKRNELIEKNNQLLEKLFNNPPFPSDGDISFSKKMFYAEKAKKIIEDVFGKIEETNELDFEHDLNKSDKDLINETFQYIRKQSKDIFEQTIDNFNRVKNEISEIDRLIRKIESDQQDEEVIKYTNNKNDAERKIEKLIEDKGVLISQVSQLKRTIESDNQRLQVLLKKIEVSEQKRKKLDKSNQYIKSLKAFINEQKSMKCKILEDAIFRDLNQIMHKANFIGGVKSDILPDGDGLKITLINQDGTIRPKQSGLSEGEKQLYISCLIKAILSLSIQELPIFIDTPLARLDVEHIEKVLKDYYPNLANQVILLATNNEIPPSRFKLMQSNVAQTYLLENKRNSTKFKQGYFQSYEN